MNYRLERFLEKFSLVQVESDLLWKPTVFSSLKSTGLMTDTGGLLLLKLLKDTGHLFGSGLKQ